MLRTTLNKQMTVPKAPRSVSQHEADSRARAEETKGMEAEADEEHIPATEPI